eukprot:m.28596 g.28596  ORF g.28596 m.28596 type:complete len:579 (+) comp4568_c0_seq2:1304-3040(+)
MIVYLYGEEFPSRTFVLLAQETATVANLRAAFMHILNEINRTDLQFRFRYKGIFWKDSKPVSDYVPEQPEWVRVEVVALARAQILAAAMDKQPKEPVLAALLREYDWFLKRERTLFSFKASIVIYLIVAIMLFATTYWFAGLWSSLHAFLALRNFPSFSRVGGCVSPMDPWAIRVVLFHSIACFANLAICTAFFALVMIDLKNGCGGTCNDWQRYSAAMYILAMLATLVSGLFAIWLRKNFLHKVGDLIVPALLDAQNIAEILAECAAGSVEDRRRLALELSAVCAASDQNKRRVVRADGLTRLVTLALGADEATKDFAAEAIAELATLEEGQSAIVNSEEGIRCLFALLHSSANSLQYAMSALAQLAKGELYVQRIINTGGLDDIIAAAHRKDINKAATEHLAAIFNGMAHFSYACRALLGSPDILQLLLMIAEDTDSTPAAQTWALEAVSKMAALEPDACPLGSEGFAIIFRQLKSGDESVRVASLEILSVLSHDLAGIGLIMKQDDLVPALASACRTGTPDFRASVALLCAILLESRKARTVLVRKGIKDLVQQLRDESQAQASIDRCLVALGAL